jgi:hypothetical protein
MTQIPAPVATMKKLAVSFLLALAPLLANGATNINDANAYSWGANVGFLNWRGDVTNGVVIGRYITSGFIYGANIGWINMGDGTPDNGIRYSNASATDFGVNTIEDPSIPGEYKLRGYAYGANVGWINFEDTGNARVVLSNNRLRGYAWGANIGWINLDDLNVFVQANNIDPGADTDGDGLPDAWERIHFGDLRFDGDDDPDGDGEDNLSEFRSNTIPSNINSVTRTARALNIATRLRVLTDTNVLIGGFIITGSEPKRVIIRAIGPSLGSQGVADALRDPVLELFDVDGNSIAFNNNWKESQQGEIEATTIPPSDDLESAIVRTLNPGNYTAVVSGFGGGVGIGLVEVYDLAAGQPARLANIATRGFVDRGDNVMIGGFIIGAGLGTNGSGSARLLLRAIGPSLGGAGIENALQDPTLELVNGNGDVLAENNNWRDSQQAEIESTGIPPSNDLEAAIVRTVPAGAYTAIVRGFDNGTGVGLVEVYNLP